MTSSLSLTVDEENPVPVHKRSLNLARIDTWCKVSFTCAISLDQKPFPYDLVDHKQTYVTKGIANDRDLRKMSKCIHAFVELLAFIFYLLLYMHGFCIV